MQFLLRRSTTFCTALLLIGSGGAQAAEPALDTIGKKSDRHLACLQMPASASLAATGPSDRPAQVLRARLTFRADAAEPGIEWLWKGDSEAATQLEAQLRGYRMPCLVAGNEQAVVQEFWVTPGTGRLEVGDVWPTPLPGPPSSCYKQPSEPFKPPRRMTGNFAALGYFRFVEGSETPEVRIAHASGAPGAAEAVIRFGQGYRRCPEGRAPDDWTEFTVRISTSDTRGPAIKPLDLPNFLGMVRGAANLRAHFDLGTMQCPFQAQLVLRQPAMPNGAGTIGAPDPNRAAFLGWLAGLQLDLPTDTEAALWGEVLTINVPCLVLNLQGAAKTPTD